MDGVCDGLYLSPADDFAVGFELGAMEDLHAGDGLHRFSVDRADDAEGRQKCLTKEKTLASASQGVGFSGRRDLTRLMSIGPLGKAQLLVWSVNELEVSHADSDFPLHFDLACAERQQLDC